MFLKRCTISIKSRYIDTSNFKIKKKRKRKINKKQHEKEEFKKRKDKNKMRKTLAKVKRLYGTYSLFFCGVSVTCQRRCLTIFLVSKFSKLSLLRSEYFLHTNIPTNYLKVSKFYSIKNGHNEENTNQRTKKQTSIILKKHLEKNKGARRKADRQTKKLVRESLKFLQPKKYQLTNTNRESENTNRERKRNQAIDLAIDTTQKISTTTKLKEPEQNTSRPAHTKD